MIMFIPFAAQAGAFSLLNAAGSFHCWYTSSRRIMLATGTVNTLIGTTAIAIYPYDGLLSNIYISAAALSASGQFLLHAFRTPKLMHPSVANAIYIAWVLALFAYGIHRCRWVYALRFD